MSLKTKSRTVLATAFLGLLSFPAHALAGSWVSGGGDPVRFVFLEGKELTTEVLANVKASSIRSKEVRDWYSEGDRPAQMLAAARAMKLNFSAENSPVCLRTEFRTGAPITVSAPACRLVGSSVEASRLLIHELTHQVGLEDEELADKIGNELYYAWSVSGRLAMCAGAEVAASPLVPRLSGTWAASKVMAERLGLDPSKEQKISEVSFRSDPRALQNFSNFPGKCAFAAGYMTFTAKRGKNGSVTVSDRPFVLIAVGGSPHIWWFERVRDDGSLDFESFGVSFVKGMKRQDYLFIGEDIPSDTANDAMMPFARKQ